MNYIDTHTHIDGEEFKDDLDEVIQRARNAGAIKLFIPAINLDSVKTIAEICQRYPEYCYGMVGLHPEEVKEDYLQVLEKMKEEIDALLSKRLSNLSPNHLIAIGEIGLDGFHQCDS